MRIGIDIDDTLAESDMVMFDLAQKYEIEELGKEIPVLNRGNNTGHIYLKELFHWSEKEEWDFWDEYYAEFLKQVRPKTLAKEYIEKLKQEGHSIFLITARFHDPKLQPVDEITKDWAKRYQIPYDKLIVDATNKLEVCIANQIDIMIDDSIRNCIKIAEYGIPTLLMDTKNNCRVEVQNKNMKRIYSWPHIYQEITKIQGGK